MSSKPLTERRQARERIAAQRAAEVHRRRMITAAIGATTVVVLAVATLVGVRLVGHSNATTVSASASVKAMTGPAPASLVTTVTSVSPQVLNTVGAGQVSTLPGLISKGTALTSAGKPEVVYVGAEYCPYCAAERWPMIIALSRFGTFHNLQLTHSSSSDVDPNTPTFSFHGASYTSNYLTFSGVETETNVPTSDGSGYTPLDNPTSTQQSLLTTYDAAPYVAAASAGSIPFADLGNQFVVSGASYDPGLLAGKTQAQVAAVLNTPSNPIAKAIDGTANALTTALCKLTGNQPATVCTTAAATADKAKLG